MQRRPDDRQDQGLESVRSQHCLFRLLVYGNSAAVTASPVAADEGSSGSNVGAMPTKHSVKAGTIVSANVDQATTTATGTGSSQAVTTSFVPAGNDQGKQKHGVRSYLHK